MDLSIIIVNYNVKEFLQNLIHSIEKASHNLSTEIIIVDNASDDGSIEFIQEKFPDIKLIINKTNLGFSKANNLGLKEAKGDFILLINPDTIVSEDTFDVLINFLKENDDVGMVGCKILNPDGTLQLACRRSFPGPWVSFCKVVGLSTLFPKSKLFAKYNLTYLDENKTYEVDAISGSFMMIKREVYEKIGGLDESFFMYGEDLDWCYRTQKAGYKVYYVHSTQIIHYKGESTKRSSIDETRFFYNAMHLFVKKHLSSSLLVGFILRSAILFREFFAFIGRVKLIIISVILDFLFFDITLFLADRIYSYLGNWKGIPHSSYPIIFTIPPIVQIIVSALMRSYKKDSLAILNSFASVFVGFFVISSMTYFFKDYAYSRAVILITYILLFFVFSGWRIFYKYFIKYGLKEVDLSLRVKTLIVGTGSSAIEIAKKLKSYYTTVHTIVGLIGLTRKNIGEKIEGFEVIGSIDNIAKIIRENNINEVIFSSNEIQYTEMMKIVSSCQKENAEFKFAGSNLDFIIGKSSINLLDDIPIFELNYNISQTFHKFIKRTFDIVLSLFILIFIYPFISLKRLFRKKRTKFANIILMVPKVLIGKMSFVGPRTVNYNHQLYLGKPGLTGLWFTENETEDNYEKLDIFYAINQNIWLDLEILGKSLSTLLTRGN